MPKPRKTLISLEATPYYHCISRCVRRAFLCGEDQLSGKNFEHRRQWIQQRLFELVDIFAIDVCSYAIMSNHFHLVLFVDQERGEGWSREAVIERWHRLFNGSPLSHRHLSGDSIGGVEQLVLDEQVAIWRSRLLDISWLMRCLNESIARRANLEDGCTGRFWEGRFRSQALLDEKALVACMAYVDLNPVRAGMAVTPEQSDYTSIAERARAAPEQSQPGHLLPFAGYPREDMPRGLPFRLDDYLELVDWSDRAIVEHKRGYIPAGLPPVLERLNIEPASWLYMSRHFENRFKGLVGAAYALKAACRKLGYRRTPNLAACERLLL